MGRKLVNLAEKSTFLWHQGSMQSISGGPLQQYWHDQKLQCIYLIVVAFFLTINLNKTYQKKEWQHVEATQQIHLRSNKENKCFSISFKVLLCHSVQSLQNKVIVKKVV